MRARLALLVSGITCELREVKLSDKPQQMIDASPKATVPVVVLDDGTVLEESIEIMRWALGRSDPLDWLSRSDDALIATNDGPFKHALDRYKYPNRHGSDPHQHRKDGIDLLRPLNEVLANQPQLSGATIGMTDAAIMPFVRQFAATDREWFDTQDLPHLIAWLDAHLASDLFARCMVRHKPWQAGDDVIPFPAA